jgi:NYN domain
VRAITRGKVTAVDTDKAADPAGSRLLRSALYVDFDNVYSGLRRVDRTAATIFANDPALLLTWLGRGEDDDGPFRRRFLVRDCYLNPQVYYWCRAQFVAAGFRVVDCPSLTQQGKSSADSHIILDVVAALSHPTHYDEFVICSADADFSPLMTKLRRHDRRTVMVAAGPSASAYESVCDAAIGPMQLVEAFASSQTGGFREHPEAAPASVTEDEVAAAAVAVRDLVAAAPAPVSGSTAAGAALRAVPAIAASGWGGAGGFAAFVRQRLAGLELLRNGSNVWLLDPTRHTAADIVPNVLPDDIVTRVCRVTRVPRLSTEQYAVLFTELAEVAPVQPALYGIGFDVRERAATRGTAVGRGAVNFVVQGLIYSGADPREGQRSPQELARCWRDNVRVLCRQAGMQLSDDDETALDTWLLDGLSPTS